MRVYYAHVILRNTTCTGTGHDRSLKRVFAREGRSPSQTRSDAFLQANHARGLTVFALFEILATPLSVSSLRLVLCCCLLDLLFPTDRLQGSRRYLQNDKASQSNKGVIREVLLPRVDMRELGPLLAFARLCSSFFLDFADPYYSYRLFALFCCHNLRHPCAHARQGVTSKIKGHSNPKENKNTAPLSSQNRETAPPRILNPPSFFLVAEPGSQERVLCFSFFCGAAQRARSNWKGEETAFQAHDPPKVWPCWGASLV